MDEFKDRMRLRAQGKRTGKQRKEPAPPPPKVEIPDYFVPPKLLKGRRTPQGEYRQLAQRLGSDPDAGKRLMQYLLDSYPDKSEVWCYQKALLDLERDRNR